MVNDTQHVDAEREGGVAGEQRAVTEVDNTVMAAASYVLGFITGIVVYVLAQDDEFARFHAAQSMAVFGLLFVLSIALSFVNTALVFSNSFVFAMLGLLVSLVSLVVWLGALVLWVYLIVRAYQGRTPRIPVAAGIADQLV